MNSSGPNPNDSLRGDPTDERVGELISEFFDRRDHGERLSQDAFIAEHPDHAAILREHFSGLDLIEKAAGSDPARTQSRIDRSPPARQRDGSSKDGALPIPEIPGYEILKPVGRGGMGIVFKAMQTSTKRVVALKLLLEGPYATDSARRRFEREIALAAQLRHSNIIPIYDSGTVDGRMYYAMEFVYGKSMTDHLKLHPMGRHDQIRMFLKVCDGLRYANQRGVIHRDIKPSNIMVDAANEPHILDFGLARAGSLSDSDQSITAQVIGTPAYMSPEQAAGDPGGIDIRTDVYSLGVVLYELMTGKMPYDTTASLGKTLHHIVHTDPVAPMSAAPGIDEELSLIILKALEKRTEARYQSVDALADDLRNYLAGEPITARPASGLYLIRKAIGKHRIVVMFTTLVLLCGAITSYVLVDSRHDRTELQEQFAQKQAELEQAQADVERTRREKEQLEIERDNVERRRKAQEELTGFIVRQVGMDERVAKGISEFSERIARGEDPMVWGPLLLQQSVRGLAEEAAGVRPKRPTSQPAADSGMPTLPAPSPEFLEVLRMLTIGKATSRPATESDAATTQPADSN